MEQLLVAEFPDSGRRAFCPLPLSKEDLESFITLTKGMGAWRWYLTEDVADWVSLEDA